MQLRRQRCPFPGTDDDEQPGDRALDHHHQHQHHDDLVGAGRSRGPRGAGSGLA